MITVRVFTREAILRAAAEKRKEVGADEEVMLEVEDLERIVGQMILDF